VGTCYRFAGNLEEAIKVNREVMAMNPNFADVYFEDALAHSQRGDHETALKQVKKSLDLSYGTKVEAGLGVVHARAGNRVEALKVIERLLQNAGKRNVSPLDIALVYSAMGDKDKAFEWLDRAYEARSGWLFELKVDPVLEPLRSDPRFTALADRIGL
jgi:tetratricopeptide (TPR) repeat protein